MIGLEFRLRERTANRTFGLHLIERRPAAFPTTGSSAMKTSIPPVSVSPQRTILAAALAVSIAAAFAIALACAVFTATSRSTGAVTFARSEKEPAPFGATQIRGCVLQDPNGPRRVWLPHRPKVVAPSGQERTAFSQASLCILLHPEGPGTVWVPHRPAIVIQSPQSATR